MDNFRNILVGVDIAADGRLAVGSESALAQAAWLARRNTATLSLVHVIDLPERAHAAMARLQQETHLLDTLAASFPGQNIRTRILCGVDWRELVDEVGRENHDLVVVGTRSHGMAGGLFGSTGKRLLRHCSCPVWVVKPREEARYAAVLVAHDLTPAGSVVLRLAAGMLRLQDAALHVLHVLEHPEQKRFPGTVAGEQLTRREENVRRQLEDECRELGLGTPVVTIANGSPHVEIMNYVDRHGIDLLCMATVERHGLLGIITGNTVEKVLPRVSCSLLATRPYRYSVGEKGR